MSSTRLPFTRSRFIALLSAIVIVVAACSSGGDTSTTQLPTLESADAEQTEPSAGEVGGDASDDTNVDGGDDTDEGGDAGPDEEVDPEIAMAEYEKCMADEGVSVQILSADDASGDSFDVADNAPTDNAPTDDSAIGQDFDQEDVEAAEEICGPILENAFGDFELSPEQEAEMADAMLEVQRCMSDAGFDIDLDGGAFEIGPEIDFEEFDAAMRACSGPLDTIGSEQ